MIHMAPWKIAVIVVVLVAGVIFALPNFLGIGPDDETPGWLPGEPVNLGLDLQGGSHLLYEVDLDGVVKESLEGIVDAVRTELHVERDIGYENLGVEGDAVRFKVSDPAKIEEVRSVLGQIAQGMDVKVSDDGQATIRFTETELTARKRRIVEQAIEVVRRRIDELGTREPNVQRQGEDRILIQLPGVKDPQQVKDIIGTTAKLTFRFVDTTTPPDAVQLPPTAERLPGDKPDSVTGVTPTYIVQKRVMVSGENLEDASVTFQTGSVLPVVAFKFDSVGAKRFGDATSQNVGKIFAIVLDNKVISAPRIKSAIIGGSGIIEGGFTAESANDLALLLRAGALPADLTVLEERTVGADLGADSIAAGGFASVLALILIVVAMVALYGLFGILAVAALIFNGILLLGALSAMGATLTLPGIAGIVLTLGMAVDANVLVFERIREEIRNGRGPVTAIDAGYREAMSTIVDSNLTTLISSLILFQFGSGPVKGFAVTLSIGIITSMFTAVMVTRFFTILWLQRARPKVLPL